MEAFYLVAFTLGPMELAIVALVALLLFGHRLPSVMRSLGQGITEFRRGVRGDLRDMDQEVEEATQ